MKFINVMYFIIAMNIVMYLTSGIGIWHPESITMGFSPKDMISMILGALSFGGFAFIATALSAQIKILNIYNPERALGYILLSSLYGAVTQLNASIVNSLELSLAGLDLSTIMTLIFGIIFLVFILQTIFGGFKSYE